MNDDLVTCGACGARNPHSASWCSQCYASLGAPGEATAAAVEVEAPLDPTETAGSKTWTCAVCSEELSIDLSTCTVCGAEIFESFGSKQWDLSAAEAMRAGVLPGGGLMKVNRSVEGIMVLIVTVFGVGFGASIISVGGAGGWLLIVLGVALWVVAAREAAVTIAAPRQALLSPKVIMGVATAIIILGMLLVFRGFPTEAIGADESLGGIPR
jgi:double zinc ribbon protein